MKHLISIYFWIVQTFWMLAFSGIELFIFMAIFVKEENLILFMDTFWILLYIIFLIINFILLCLFWYLSDKYQIDTRNI